MSSYPTVFVSHSHKDNAFGLRLIADLRARLGDENVWYDVSGGLHGGDEWWREIVRQITARDVFVVILSPNALASPYVQREMAMAYQLHLTRNKRLLPIRYQPCDLEIDWEIIHWLPCRDPLIDAKGYTYNVTAILADLLRSPASGTQPQPTPPVPAPPPPRVQPAIAPDHFPQRLASLGFVGRILNGVEVITPPLCDVPAGPFLMGSDKRRDKEARADELPQQSVTLAAYQIARYPVTVAEYACYARATGNKPFDWQSQLQQFDHPVNYISWKDATSYATWLAQTTVQPWRLPTEAEWEKAARGTDGRIYPWGDTWDKSRANANTGDDGPHTTMPVGSYPSGASPYGAQDMASNVKEWTSSLYTPYPYNRATSEDDGRRNRPDVRVTRGSYWLFPPQFARAAIRLGFDLDNWASLGGFRVVCGVGAGTN